MIRFAHFLRFSLLITALALLLTPSLLFAEGSVTFRSVPVGGASLDSATFSRARSVDYATIEQLQLASQEAPLPLAAAAQSPFGGYGLPGVAIFDFDGDSDLDIFVTNGPGAPNSLFSNQLSETGSATFEDVGVAAGLATTAMDANGTCFGDLDNDGDKDLLVLGRSAPSKLFENKGDGTFREAAGSGVAADNRSHISCSMGDVDGDGLLDIVVSNTFPIADMLAIFAVPFDLNQHNQLFRNEGGLTFTDISAAAGIEQMDGLPPGAAGITWGTSMADVDLDGDLDIVFADDNGAIPVTKVDPVNGVDRGYMQIMLNDGSGSFTASAVNTRPEAAGSWMGVSFGDVDCNGTMDILGSNFGDYNMPIIGLPYDLGDQATRVLFGNGDGSFADPGVGSQIAATFGWGNAVFDVDNDGDQDLLNLGGLDLLMLAVEDSLGTLLLNDGCSGDFTPDTEALGGRHLRRNPRGAAIGDLDRDGYVDIVSTADFTIPEPIPLVPGVATYGSALDSGSFFVPLFAPVGPDQFVWTGIELPPGDLMVELNNGESGHGSVTIQTLGTVDITRRGAVNRDGIGAVVSFTPHRGNTTMMPITGGASHLSAHSPEAYFGMGSARFGTVDVLWPGGVRNRLYGVRAGETVEMPEIPCSIDTGRGLGRYLACVNRSLRDLRRAREITRRESNRLKASAILAFFDERY